MYAPVAAAPPPQPEGRPVYLIGYPIRDARRNEPELIARIFRDVYNVKRIQPGQLRGTFAFHEIQLLRHDCAPLGQTDADTTSQSGGCPNDHRPHAGVTRMRRASSRVSSFSSMLEGLTTFTVMPFLASSRARERESATTAAFAAAYAEIFA